MGPGVEAFLVYAVAALLSCAVSFVLGRHWPSPAQLDEAWEDGYDVAVAEMRDLPVPDHPARPDELPAARLPELPPSGGPEGPPGVHARDAGGWPALAGVGGVPLELDVPRPEVVAERGPGRLPSQDTYRAELARIGRPDPAPWYAALQAPDPPVEPGPPAEPAWLERLLYKGAMSTAWCETFNSREMEVFHAHVDEWDRYIAAWGVEARWVTVGCRAWPPPGLVPA